MIRWASYREIHHAAPDDGSPASFDPALIGKTAMDPLHPMLRTTPNDTDPRVEAVLIEGYRRMTPSEKLERVRALTRAVQELALLDIRQRHPDADEREQALRLASRWIEPELMVRAFGWDVRKVGY
jgi:hypothetical protein